MKTLVKIFCTFPEDHHFRQAEERLVKGIIITMTLIAVDLVVLYAVCEKSCGRIV